MCLVYSPTTGTKEACGVTFIDEDQRSILFGQITDTLQRSHISVHGENTVCDHQPQTRGLWRKIDKVTNLKHNLMLKMRNAS